MLIPVPFRPPVGTDPHELVDILRTGPIFGVAAEQAMIRHGIFNRGWHVGAVKVVPVAEAQDRWPGVTIPVASEPWPS